MSEDYIKISKKELRQLLFWAHVGTLHAKGGSYQDSIPKLIVKTMGRLNLGPWNFCCFKQPFGSSKWNLGMKVFSEWRRCKRGWRAGSR